MEDTVAFDAILFWRDFQILPWKWMDRLFFHPKYLGGSILFTIILLFLGNSYPIPGKLKEITGRETVLETYPSILILLIGWLVTLLLIIRWRHKIPKFFVWLAASGRLEIPGGNFQPQYERYLKDFQKELRSHKVSLPLSLALLLLVIFLVIRPGMFPFIAEYHEPAGIILLDTALVIGIFWVFCIGQICSVLYITGSFIRQLPERFHINIQPGHPDQCGGLSVIGDFFIDAALPIILAGAMLVLVSLQSLDYNRVLNFSASIMLYTLIGPMTLAAIFWPVWGIHELMRESRLGYQDSYAEQLRKLEHQVRSQTQEQGDLGEAKIAKQKLEILLSMEHPAGAFPVWPFRLTPTLIGIFSPQIIRFFLEIFIDLDSLLPF
jgi:hypothetical protein